MQSDLRTNLKQKLKAERLKRSSAQTQRTFLEKSKVPAELVDNCMSQLKNKNSAQHITSLLSQIKNLSKQLNQSVPETQVATPEVVSDQ